jgi:hypothetical protein
MAFPVVALLPDRGTTRPLFKERPPRVVGDQPQAKQSGVPACLGALARECNGSGPISKGRTDRHGKVPLRRRRGASHRTPGSWRTVLGTRGMVDPIRHDQ